METKALLNLSSCQFAHGRKNTQKEPGNADIQAVIVAGSPIPTAWFVKGAWGG